MCIIYRPHAHNKAEERRQSMRESTEFPSSSNKYADMSDKQQSESGMDQMEVSNRGETGNADENVPLMTWAGCYFHSLLYT